MPADPEAESLPLRPEQSAFDRPPALRAAAALLALGIFLVDSLSPLEGAVAVLYVIVIMVLARGGRFEDIVIGTVGCMTLTWVSYFWSHGLAVGSPLVRVLVSISAVGIAAFLAFRIQSATDTLLKQAKLLDLSHDSIFACDPNDQITFWSQGAEKLYGWPAGDAVGSVAHTLLHTEYSVPPGEIWSELMSTGRWEGELTQHRRSGAPVTVESRWALQRGSRGQPVAVLQTETDITERRKALRALTDSERRYRTIFETSRVGIMQQDWTAVKVALDNLAATGVRDLAAYLASNPAFLRSAQKLVRIIDANAVTLRMYGAPDRQQFARTLDQLLDEDDITFRRTLLTISRGGGFYEDETEITTKSGNMPVMFGITFPQESIGFGNVLVFIVDVTERKQAHEALLAAQADLAHAARVSTLGELTASIAHEVNQPLAAIVTNGDAALRWLRRPEPDIGEVTDAITRVIRDGKRAGEIVSRIRSFLSKSPTVRTEIDLAEIIEESRALVDRELVRHDVSLHLVLEGTLPALAGDRVQLQQVLINLMVNGIQAMARVDGARALTVSAVRDETGGVAVAVSDTGVGIDEADVERLFKPFFTTKSDGMGMGLAICRSTIEAHGGQLWASRNRDAGATFHFSLPPRDESRA